LKGTFVITSIKNNPGNESTKFTQLERTLARGNIYLGTYTFFIKEPFSSIEPIAVFVAST